MIRPYGSSFLGMAPQGVQKKEDPRNRDTVSADAAQLTCGLYLLRFETVGDIFNGFWYFEEISHRDARTRESLPVPA